MQTELNNVLQTIGYAYKENIGGGTRNYMEIDIGQMAEKLGYSALSEKFRKVNAILPLKQPVNGMKVRIDGRTFVDYAKFASGVVVPGYVARETGLPFERFEAQDSMILNFA
jgi:hypothetical protein